MRMQWQRIGNEDIAPLRVWDNPADGVVGLLSKEVLSQMKYNFETHSEVLSCSKSLNDIWSYLGEVVVALWLTVE